MLDRKLTAAEKEEAYQTFLAIGRRMGIPELPPTYEAWLPVRAAHLQNDLAKSKYTVDLYKQYRKHLGAVRFWILKESQKMVVPQRVWKLLGLGKVSLVAPALLVYKWSRNFKGDRLIKAAILPPAYKQRVDALDVV